MLSRAVAGKRAGEQNWPEYGQGYGQKGILRAVCVFFCFLMLAGTPARAGEADAARRCVQEVGEAIDAADAPRFERLVDVDAILHEGLNLFLQQVQQPQVAAQLPPMLALLFSDAARKDSTVRSVLHNETRAFVLNGVASGAFAGRTPSGESAQGMLAPLFAEASKGRKEIREIGRPLPHEADWLVPFMVHDGGNDRTYAVLGRVGKAEDGQGAYWRLLAVENMQELFLKIWAESQAL